eukprot:PhF_6_TR31499/c0_g7_i1/m.46372
MVWILIRHIHNNMSLRKSFGYTGFKGMGGLKLANGITIGVGHGAVVNLCRLRTAALARRLEPHQHHPPVTHDLQENLSAPDMEKPAHACKVLGNSAPRSKSQWRACPYKMCFLHHGMVDDNKCNLCGR